MYPELKGKGLFVFSDPGGAKPVLSLVHLESDIDSLVISDRIYDFFSDFNIPIELYTSDCENDIFLEFKPDFVLTGTSYTSSIELKFINQARNNNILSIAFIDHYTRYMDRFKYRDKYVFPDYIFLTDYRAKSIALLEKIDKESKLFVTGNFYHTFIKTWTPTVSRKKFLKQNDLAPLSKIITFAPDPLTNVGGKDKFGYDEIDVWDALQRCLQQIDCSTYTVFVKIHPNQPGSIFKEYILNSGFGQVRFTDEIHTNTLIFFSDIVVGMYSSFLIEAQQMNRSAIIRYLPSLEQSDSLEGLNIGLVCSNENELLKTLRKLL